MSVKPQELAHNCGRLRTFLTEWIACLLESAFSEWNWRDGWRPQNVPCKVFHSSCANRATHIKGGCQQTPISSLWQKGNESLTTLQAAGSLWNIYESWSQFSQWQSLGNTCLFLLLLLRLCGIIGDIFSTTDMLHGIENFIVKIIHCHFRLGSYKPVHSIGLEDGHASNHWPLLENNTHPHLLRGESYLPET